MPELPEAEVVRRRLVRWTTGRRVATVDVLDPAKVGGTAPLDHLAGLEVLGWERRGKQLLGRFEGGWVLLSRLGMTGQWVREAPAGRGRFVRLRLAFEPARPGAPDAVVLEDARRFGATQLVRAEGLSEHPWLTRLGPDPLRDPLDATVVLERLGRSRVPLKVRLLDQSVFAGLGNIAVLEAAFRARLHPLRPSDGLSRAEAARLATALRAHLVHTLEAERGDAIAYLSLGATENPFLVYGRQGERCPRCGAPIARETHRGRPTYWCRRCQPLPAVSRR